MSAPLLSPLDASNLRTRGLLLPSPTPSTHLLHKRHLTHLSAIEYRLLPLSAPFPQNAFAAIPTHLESFESLLHVGLSNAKATEIWNRWVEDWPADGPRRETDPDDGWGLQVTFLDLIMGSLENKVDAISSNDHEWRTCLDARGIDVATQDAIMDPALADLRRTKSCLDWARDSIEMRYKGLVEIQRSSRMREVKLQKAVDDLGWSQGSEKEKGIANTEADIWGSPTAIEALDMPGYTTLFKAVDEARLVGLLDHTGALSKIERLLSPAPSGFNGSRSGFHFTPDPSIASYQAAYAKRRARYESIVIVSFRIPNTAIERLSEPDIQRVF
ncbi:hypothetical protein V494_03544 [Pseudogymnoascus sp. VKM F-4513 (FW-928)]|nr:hypothetical protein V494_03544 [Pseudogymnoascus sp. VKM F-4513 (FW-928)]